MEICASQCQRPVTDRGIGAVDALTAALLHRDLAVSYVPPGRLVAALSTDVLDFFDTRTGRPSGASIDLGAGGGDAFAVSPDGSLVATGGSDGRQTVGEPLVGFPRPPSFSPDGATMATSSLRNTLLWTLDPVIWRERACEIAGRSLTDAEVREYLPNHTDAPPTCADFPRAEVRQGDP